MLSILELGSWIEKEFFFISTGCSGWIRIRKRIEEHLHISPPLHTITATTMSGIIDRKWRINKRCAEGFLGWTNAGRWRPVQVSDDGDSVPAGKRFSVSSNVASSGQDPEGYQRGQPGRSSPSNGLHLESVMPVVNEFNLVKVWFCALPSSVIISEENKTCFFPVCLQCPQQSSSRYFTRKVKSKNLL